MRADGIGGAADQECWRSGAELTLPGSLVKSDVDSAENTGRAEGEGAPAQLDHPAMTSDASEFLALGEYWLWNILYR